LRLALTRPMLTVLAILGLFAVSLGVYPYLGVSFFPRTDPGQFVINVKAASGTRLEVTEQYVKRVEDLVRQTVDPGDLGVIVSNIGVTPGFSSIYSSNSGPHTAFVQVDLKDDHKVGSYDYMDRVREKIRQEAPGISCYFQTGGLADAVLNLGMPAPIDIQVSGSNLENAYGTAAEIAARLRRVKGVSDVLIPQDLDYPALQLAIDRGRAAEMGLSEKEVVDNVITALTSNQMIAPSYWVDPKTGNDYMLTVQYPEDQAKSLADLKGIPLRANDRSRTTLLDSVSDVHRMSSPTEVDHYQLRREIDVYVAPSGEDLGRVASQVDNIVSGMKLPEGVQVDLRGMVQGMRASFKSFGIGLLLSVVLVYLILVAQFRSFIDPFLILLAVPMGLTGVLITLYLTGTTMNVMSLMGIVMMVGMAVTNSILILEYAHRMRDEGLDASEAAVTASRVRMRPVLMISLATIIGLMPMTLHLGAGSESYAPLARSIIGGLGVSVVFTVFIVPASYLLVYRNRDKSRDTAAVEAEGA
ncbi:MAG: efflux RND transporter permease subunit, partial [Blastocatellia bacterium]